MAGMFVFGAPNETHRVSLPHNRHPGFSPGTKRECQNTAAIVPGDTPAWIPAYAGMTLEE